MMVDEADAEMIGANPGAGGTGRGTKRPVENSGIGGLRPNKRRRGPLPPEVTLQRIRSPRPSSPSSPAPPIGEEIAPISDGIIRPEQLVLMRQEPIGPPPPPLTPPPQGAVVPPSLSPANSPAVVTSPIISNLAPSPCVFTPGYPPVSPPGSPAYPLDNEVNQYNNDPHPLLNGGTYIFYSHPILY